MSGIFEPLYGKSSKAAFKPTTPAAEIPRPAPNEPVIPTQTFSSQTAQAQTAQIIDSLTKPFVKKNELGQLFQELDRSKVFILVLLVALVIVFTLLLIVNSRQKKQRTNILALQKRLKRLKK